MKIRGVFPAAAVVTLLTACSVAPRATPTQEVMTASMQRSLTPDAVVADLKAGNERFVAQRSRTYDLMAQARKTSSGQYPKAIVLGCLDSRVPPEVVFDQGIGDIFVGRVAGNFESEDMVGSMEFGTRLAGAKLIVVLGHTSCGAINGTIDQAQMGNLTATLSNIEPAVVAVLKPGEERSSSNAALVGRVIEENVRQTVRDVQSRSPVITDLVRDGSLRVVGAVYDLETGRVRWIDT